MFDFIYGRSCLLRFAVGVLRATLLLRCCAPCWRMPSACLTQKKCFLWGWWVYPPTRPRGKMR